MLNRQLHTIKLPIGVDAGTIDVVFTTGQEVTIPKASSGMVANRNVKFITIDHHCMSIECQVSVRVAVQVLGCFDTVAGFAAPIVDGDTMTIVVHALQFEQKRASRDQECRATRVVTIPLPQGVPVDKRVVIHSL